MIVGIFVGLADEGAPLVGLTDSVPVGTAGSGIFSAPGGVASAPLGVCSSVMLNSSTLSVAAMLARAEISGLVVLLSEAWGSVGFAFSSGFSDAPVVDWGVKKAIKGVDDSVEYGGSEAESSWFDTVVINSGKKMSLGLFVGVVMVRLRVLVLAGVWVGLAEGTSPSGGEGVSVSGASVIEGSNPLSDGVSGS